ncbi:MAG: BamA/TamA family outer membrane protein [Candidatus Omnitrophota bacterium]
MFFRKKAVFLFCAVSIFGALFYGLLNASAEDKYAPVYEEPLRATALKDPLSRLIALPLEILRWPLGKGLVFLEKEYIPEKADWAYSYLHDHGIFPSAGYMSSQGVQAGLHLDLSRLSKLDQKVEGLRLEGWNYYGKEIYYQAGGEVGLDHLAGSPLSTSVLGQYENRWEDDFYGIGPESSRDHEASYKNETTTVQGKVGYELSSALKGTARMTFENAHIGPGKEDEHGQLERFGLENIPGSGGGRTLVWDGGLHHDTRDFKDNPTRGGYRSLKFGYGEGLSDSKASYFLYQTDVAQYIKVGSPRRVLALRGLMEHRDEVGSGSIPFYQMSKLGGYGTMPEMSRTLRSYDVNRFFDESLVLLNAEYRYAIWENRGWQLDAVPFFDLGRVFGEWSQFGFDDLKESYGGELRIFSSRKSVVNFSVAHGDEGTNFYVRTKKAF